MIRDGQGWDVGPVSIGERTVDRRNRNAVLPFRRKQDTKCPQPPFVEHPTQAVKKMMRSKRFGHLVSNLISTENEVKKLLCKNSKKLYYNLYIVPFKPA
jgi:hypothetical protein